MLFSSNIVPASASWSDDFLNVSVMILTPGFVFIPLTIFSVRVIESLDLKFGSGWNAVFMDEEPPRDVFSAIKPKIAVMPGYVFISMTPDKGMSWTYDLLNGSDPDHGVLAKNGMHQDVGRHQAFAKPIRQAQMTQFTIPPKPALTTSLPTKMTLAGSSRMPLRT